jgi:hypothetical protein
MLSPARYLLGTVEIALLLGFAWLGASTLRSCLLPRLSGAPAHLALAVLTLALLLCERSSRGWRGGGGPPRRGGAQPRAPWGMPPRQDPRAGAP